MTSLQSFAANLIGLDMTDNGSAWDVEMGTEVGGVGQVGQVEGLQANGSDGTNDQVDGQAGSAAEEGSNVVEQVSADAGVQASTTTAASSALAPTAGPSMTSGGDAANVAGAPDREDNRVRLNLSWPGCRGCGVSLPLTRNGMYVLLGLAIVAILIGLIALGITVVQNSKSK
ncbi:hypothetical protein K488DRAFT_75163 [Vararia minispora EC-137]|uniref:Uncharacterized protein n=1 Tax=Vararia minispora EC-137 TaxID=1314806 RepID=A0ACB8Q4I0_9AGAM|nr:hypothetical protein K488DRAFT_75163 [Vararia minispora EC-137]